MKTTFKNLIVLALTIMTSTLWANNPQSFLNVSAASGLNMRTVPGGQGQVIKTIPFGEQVMLVNDENELGYEERVDWIDGRWILIEHDGEIGYVFNGFLTDLPIPEEVDEFSCEDIDISYPLESWMKNNFTSQAAPDTIFGSTTIGVVQQFAEGHVFKEKDKQFQFEVLAELQDTEVMEVYQILLNMLSSKPEKVSFLNQSTFVEDEFGRIRKVKVDIDFPVYITRLPNQTVAVKVLTYKSGCTL